MSNGQGLPVLRAGLAEVGLALDEDAGWRFARYLQSLLADARRLGLSAVTDPDEVQRRHFLEPAALAVLLSRRGLLAPGVRVLDLGSGAGFPGLPLKILFPAVDLTLVEATKKKAGWLERLVTALELEGVRVLDARAEDLGRDPSHRARYDIVTARAVAPLRVLLEMALPLLRVGGLLAAPKGERASQEVAEAGHAAQVLSAAVEVERLEVPFVAHQPLVVLATKTGETPERYPRRAGILSKRPL